jgi:hypothetical protein
MSTRPNIKLSEHFTLYEIMHGTNLSAASAMLNWKAYDKEFKLDKWRALCAAVEVVRAVMNDGRYDSLKLDPTRDIGFEVTAGFRCLAHEKSRGRAGTSQHTVNAALDVQPTNVGRNNAVKILRELHAMYDPTWGGGLAISHPRTKQSIGFIHFDLGNRRRWTY